MGKLKRKQPGAPSDTVMRLGWKTEAEWKKFEAVMNLAPDELTMKDKFLYICDIVIEKEALNLDVNKMLLMGLLSNFTEGLTKHGFYHQRSIVEFIGEILINPLTQKGAVHFIANNKKIKAEVMKINEDVEFKRTVEREMKRQKEAKPVTGRVVHNHKVSPVIEKIKEGMR